jgi:DNA repair exonuclease SbcCD ATPase subunit
MFDITTYSKKLDQLKGRRVFLERCLNELEQKKKGLSERLMSIEEAQVFIQRIAKETQEQLRFHIEDIVQLALDAVFPGEYEFRVVFEIKRGKTEARLCFLKNDIEIDPLTSAGGGVSDVVSFALRLAVWSLGRTRRLIILDEPFRFLSKNLQARAGDILKKLSHKLKLQVIMVTHEEQMIDIADKKFSVKLERSGEYKKSVIHVL